MSTNRTWPPGQVTTASTASRVVPASSYTTERSRPTNRLNSEDFPTFGRPTMVKRGSPASSWASFGSAWGRSMTIRSSRSPAPRPWSAETGTGSPKPNEKNRAASG